MDVSQIPGVDEAAETTMEVFELTTIDSNLALRDKDIAADYNKVRVTMDFQQQMLMESIKIALEAARNSEAPKSMEVVATLMAQLTTLNTKIISIHKDIADLAKPTANPDAPKATIQAENVYIGSTADLMDQYGSQQDAQDEKLVNQDED
ncbi:terminase small subunit [Paraglaciecola Antarctic GD virus 1]|nr:terminase small subunit [Paraglaciecola Antarctic GD virus 1]